MNNREYFLKRWDGEQRAFSEVLRAVPNDQLSYTPHERSTKAGDLAWQIALEQRLLIDLLDKQKMVWESLPRPESIDGIVAAYDEATNTLRDKLKHFDDSKWELPAKFMFGEHVAGESTVQDFAWGFLFDLVHHRGQLTAYLRPMGAKVPSIYGPSGDSGAGS
ncbi:MAG: hypothetical protein JO197_24070 [Acidobacteria bacterium]|nr:hypothetical protein [Acidobacteriota bacterium]MBV9474936.1 hypothetical protein [Acidobacteriota bacterium]